MSKDKTKNNIDKKFNSLIAIAKKQKSMDTKTSFRQCYGCYDACNVCTVFNNIQRGVIK